MMSCRIRTAMKGEGRAIVSMENAFLSCIISLCCSLSFLLSVSLFKYISIFLCTSLWLCFQEKCSRDMTKVSGIRHCKAI